MLDKDHWTVWEKRCTARWLRLAIPFEVLEQAEQLFPICTPEGRLDQLSWRWGISIAKRITFLCSLVAGAIRRWSSSGRSAVDNLQPGLNCDSDIYTIDLGGAPISGTVPALDQTVAIRGVGSLRVG